MDKEQAIVLAKKYKKMVASLLPVKPCIFMALIAKEIIGRIVI